MKLYIKFLVLVLVVALVAPFFLRGPDGRPLLRLADLRNDLGRQAHSAKTWLTRTTGNIRQAAGGRDSAPVPVYRWKDARGQWYFSSSPPEHGNAEIVLIDPDTNVIEALPDKKPASAHDAASGAAATEGRDGPGFAAPLSISPSKLKTLVDDAKTLHDTAAEREARTQASGRD